jgi:glycosyltransferase involved in cell wall biosynthesis
MKISIIINNYNYDKFLEEAVTSALNQTYANKEVIIVDDGSTDRSGEILDKYKNQVKVIRKANGGQASAFNTGFAASSGDLILFLDSDDRLYPQACAEAVAAWQPGSSRLQFNLNIIDAMGKLTGNAYSQIFLEGIMISGDYRRLIEEYRLICLPTSGNVFSRQVLEKVFPIDEQDWRLCADTPLIVATAYYGPVQSIMTPLGDYRMHNNGWFRSGNISAKDYFKQMDLRLRTEKFRGVDSKRRRYWMAKLAYEKLETGVNYWPTVWEGVQASKLESANMFERVVEMAWFPWVALLPKSISRKIFEHHLPIGKPHICPHNLAKAKREYKPF